MSRTCATRWRTRSSRCSSEFACRGILGPRLRLEFVEPFPRRLKVACNLLTQGSDWARSLSATLRAFTYAAGRGFSATESVVFHTRSASSSPSIHA